LNRGLIRHSLGDNGVRIAIEMLKKVALEAVYCDLGPSSNTGTGTPSLFFLTEGLLAITARREARQESFSRGRLSFLKPPEKKRQCDGE